MGTSRWQILRTVQLPMARRTIIVGLNQCTMAALSMATIAALINGPGLGQPVAQALQSLDIGNAFVSGIAIVIMAIVLDRTTTAASERAEVATRHGRDEPAQPAGSGSSPAGSSRWSASTCPGCTCSWPSSRRSPISARRWRPGSAPSPTGWCSAVSGFTGAITTLVSTLLLNPLQSLLADSPWWLMFLVLLAVAYLAGGWRPTAIALVCLLVILGTGLWNESMKTLTTTLVATLAVIVIAMVVGVWMGRNRRADTAVRPFLDAFQTIPPFVYLVPALALFGTSRFTAIVAAVAFGVPVATKLIADGIRGVSPTSVEAARASGTTAWQMISRVQLPMAQGRRGAGVQPGAAVRAVDGGHRRSGRWWRPRLLRGRRVLPGPAVRQGAGRGHRDHRPGVMLDRVAQYAAARYGRR